MADKIQLSIVTPDGTAFEKRVSYVNIPTGFGSVGILANHAPMLCAVKKGMLLCRTENGEEKRVFVGDGVANTAENEVTLLVSDAREME